MTRLVDELSSPWAPCGTPAEETDLRATLWRLQEENLRLRSERNGGGTRAEAVVRLRHGSARQNPEELTDEAWSALAEAIATREALDQATREIDAAIDAIRDRIARLTPDRCARLERLPGSGSRPAA